MTLTELLKQDPEEDLLGYGSHQKKKDTPQGRKSRRGTSRTSLGAAHDDDEDDEISEENSKADSHAVELLFSEQPAQEVEEQPFFNVEVEVQEESL